jgi:antitoxin CptB
MAETDDVRRKRLLFRSWHRGTKETDQVLGSFADKYLAGFSPEQLDAYDRLLDLEDVDLWDWLTGRDDPPPEARSEVLSLLLDFSLTDPAV